MTVSDTHERGGWCVAYGTGRTSAQRRAVSDAAAEFSGAFTAEDLAARVRRASSGVSTATVYRSLAAMAASGFLTPVGERDGATLYARCEKPGHHHHLVCTACGATAHAPCPVDEAGVAASAPEGFIVTAHEVRLYGLCAACSRAAAAASQTTAADSCSCDAEAG